MLRRHQRHPRRRGRNLHPPPLHRLAAAADSRDVLLLLSRRPRVVHLPFRGAVRGPVRRRRRATDRLGVGAHVAHLLAPAASTRGSLLAEVTQQNRPPARPNPPSVRVDRAAVTAIHLPELVQLVRTAVQDASRGQRVPPGPAALLVQALEGRRRAPVRDETNIRLVHAHPKRDGGHDAVQVTLPPVPLGPLQRLLVTSRVVHLAVELQILKCRRESFALVTGPGVNHADGPGISFLGLLRHRREVRQRDSLGTDLVPGLGTDLVPVSHVLATYDLVPQVWSVEGSRDEDGIFQPERFDNLVLDPRRGRRGERLEGHAGCDVVPEVLQREVRGPEVVAPARDAVRLVDGD